MSVLLIPCYEPDERLLALIDTIRFERPSQHIVLVDDGSGPDFAAIFDAARWAGCDVLQYAENAGKGHALKFGLSYMHRAYPGCDVVCADCDGQHTAADIARVSDALADGVAAIVLGARQFVGEVPAKSRFGNTMTRIVFGRVTGTHLQDTQTGLRGYRAELLPWLLAVAGEHFEYELEILLAAERDGITIAEVEISTIYLNGNESTHFKPLRDSLRVYSAFLRFSLASLSAFALDALLLVLFFNLTGSLLVAVVGARVASASFNFALNGRVVFDRHPNAPPGAGRRYAALAVALLGANYLMLRAITWIGVPLLVAKVVTDVALFLLSYNVQRRFAFGRTDEVLISYPTPSPAGFCGAGSAKSGTTCTTER